MIIKQSVGLFIQTQMLKQFLVTQTLIIPKMEKPPGKCFGWNMDLVIYHTIQNTSL